MGEVFADMITEPEAIHAGSHESSRIGLGFT